MYGTIARMKTRPGALQAIKEMEMHHPKGMVATYVYQMDNHPDELWMVVLFENKAAYRANAESPEQDKEFRNLMKNLVEEPAWHDGEVVFESHAN
jgi:quinol monooxygenase YgiN